MTTEATDIGALSFEEALAELEKIVAGLESGNAPLDRSIEMYERGARLKAHCESRLEAARLRVEKIVVGQGGEAKAAAPADFSCTRIDIVAERVAEAADLVTVALDQLLPRADGPEQRLTEAMRYAALGPGKRLRPFFAMESARLFDVEERPVLRAACALECIHAYSLVHDDLPCMDDDDLRRGRATVHRAFDEATAVLAGDGLLTMAFEVLADQRSDADGLIQCRLVRELALGAGGNGMIGGQMLVME